MTRGEALGIEVPVAGVAGDQQAALFGQGCWSPGIPVRRPDLVETTALGAAGLAGLAVGIWSNPEDFIASQGESTRFTSGMSDNERAALLAGWAQAVRAVKGLAEGGLRL